MLSRTAQTLRALPLARHMHASPLRTSEAARGGPRVSSYDTPGGATDPFKTVSSGYAHSDQGVVLEDTRGVRPEELHDAAANTSAEGAERPKEMQVDQGLTEATQSGLIGS
jgi:hypothetical protein